MARNSQAALLDQLMGYDRNCTRKKEITWDDERICTSYLAGFCPHDLFVNTRISLGPCIHIHEENFLKKYKESSSYLKVGYEKKLQRILQGFVKDVQSKIKYNEEKLKTNFRPTIENTLENRIKIQNEEIDDLVNKIEQFGNEGKIEECQNLCAELDEKQKQFKYNKIELERLKEDAVVNQDVVCNICGAFTSKNDLKSSVENHINGKIHCGYEKINEVLNELELVLNNTNDISKNSNQDSPTNSKRNYKESYDESRESSRHRRSSRNDYYKEERNERNNRKSKEYKHSRKRSRSDSRNSSYHNKKRRH